MQLIKNFCKENFPNMTVFESIILMSLSILGVLLILVFFLDIFQFFHTLTIAIGNFIYEYSGKQPLMFFASIILSGLTIYLAKKANDVAKQSKEIAQKALEMDRPILKVADKFKETFKKTLGEVTQYKVYIENTGTQDAIITNILIKNSSNLEIEVQKRYINSLIGSKSKFALNMKIESDYPSILIFYKNILTEKKYVLGFNIDIRSSSPKQIGENNKSIGLISPISIEEYSKFYED